MTNGVSRGMSVLFLIVTILFFYLVGSLFSWSFDMEDWHLFSKIIFWGPSIILTVWTITDYFIFPDKR